MSTDFRGLRPSSNDPIVQYISELQNKFTKFITKDAVAAVESDNEDIFSDGIDVESVIKYHTIQSQQLFTFNKKFYPAGDAGRIKLWIRGNNLGNSTKDTSGSNHPATIYGDPTLVDGILDLGIHTYGIKSIARRMNRPTSDFENLEWMQVADAPELQVTGTTGFSIFVRFRPFSLADQNGRSPTVFEKIDDSTPTNAKMLQLKDDGRIVFAVKHLGITYAKETLTTAIPLASQPGAVYDTFVTYNPADHTIHIYVDGSDKPLQDFVGTVNWQTDLTNHDLFIFRRGAGTEEGFLYGDFYDLKIYPDWIVSQAEVTYHYANKWTTSNIPFGQVMISNYWATFGSVIGVPGLCSFSSVSFSPTSFSICVGTGGVLGDAYDDLQFDPLQFE